MTETRRAASGRVAVLLVLVAAAGLVLWLSGGRAERTLATDAMPCADLDGDDTVSKIDADIEASYFGQTVPVPAPAAADLVADGIINLADVAAVAGASGMYTLCQDKPITFKGGPPAKGGMFGPDTDGDGCSDTSENLLLATDGGLRDYLNPWDYFNPTGDGVNAIDDVLAVIINYGPTAGTPGYDTAYDRSYLGPDLWDLGPPSGAVTIADVLAAVYQFGHNCP